MKKKVLSVLSALSLLFTLIGCHSTPEQVEEVPSTTFASIPPESSSIIESSSNSSLPESSSGEIIPLLYSFDDISFTEIDDPEAPGSLAISYPQGMFTGQPLWIDSSHIYLQPSKNTDFGVMADVKNRTFTKTPAQTFHWVNTIYQDDSLFLIIDDCNTIQKLDRDLNLLPAVSFGQEAEDYSSAVDPTSETLYYIRNDLDTPSLWKKRGDNTEPITELPPLADKEFYAYLQISPSGDKLLFYKIYYEMLAKCIYVYDINTDTLTETSRENEDGQSGFWMPSGIWMGEQPVFLLYHEDEQNSNEILYGNPPESKIQSFYDPEESIASLLKDEWNSWGCISYIVIDYQDHFQEKIFYFRDNDTYLSRIPQNKGDSTSFYPQLSPDYGYLSYTPSLDNPNTREELHIISTDNLWKPLDWLQVQAELDKMAEDLSKKE